MPAITVDDLTVLPRIAARDPLTARPRPVKSVTTAPKGFEGEGFPVRRAFAGIDMAHEVNEAALLQRGAAPSMKPLERL